MKGVCTVNLFKQLFWLFFFSIVGEIISLLIRPLISLPASVIGMVLLFLCLHYSILSMEKVEGSVAKF
ncbi:MAG: CidA/LrgA family protein [Facklamia hominis]